MTTYLMQLNKGGLFTYDYLRVLITKLREGKDEWRLKYANYKFVLEFQNQVSHCLRISYKCGKLWTFSSLKNYKKS